ncbi:glycosyl transferase family 1 [Methylobacterium sp. Leaf456]|uniref:glycosyltransferase family 4 protein n=1 Tax=Methylobacterium sp. Leaf456 TaxID=1736382 RepID=UPI0006F6A11F|nr:glycosyltransferase family 4 protein [Methylobacterium sp. Leaf456]KQT47659.1 glycosyl transferase family 1 [Methylobacterium sp. Leaf456]
MGRPERVPVISPEARERRPVVVVTGALAPYTHVLYERLAERLDRPLHVLSCTPREAARQWVVEAPRLFRHAVLPGLRWHRDAVRNLYVNPAVVPRLAALDPVGIVLNDFSPTMLMAAAYARLRRIPYLIRTDGVPETDPGQRSTPHRWLRKAIVSGARGGIGPSAGSARLLALYGIGPEKFATSPLFPAWAPAGPLPPDSKRPYDVLFCGILNEEVKGARFFTDVILGCAARGRRLSVRVAGDGPLRAEMEARFAQAGIAAQFDGYLTQAALPAVYASTRLFLFPSRGDVWGIVVHEALQSGTSVLASPHSGIARDLVAVEGCGEVRELETQAWIEATLALLDDAPRRQALREAASRALTGYTSEAAVQGYLDGLRPILAAWP